MPREITSLGSLLELINSPKVTVVDFYATWCGPCKAVAPQYEQMSHQFDEKVCVFCKVDVDRCPDVAQRYNITAMPTFAIFRGGELIETVRGADLARVRAIVDAQVRLVPTSFSGQGRTLGSSSAPGAAAARASHPIASLFFKLRAAEDALTRKEVCEALMKEVKKTVPLGVSLVPCLFMSSLPGKGPDVSTVLSTLLEQLDSSSVEGDRANAVAIVTNMTSFLLAAAKKLTWEANDGGKLHAAVLNLVKSPIAAQILSNSFWLRGSHAATAESIEQATLLGRLLRCGLDMKGATGHRAEQLAIITAFPADPFKPGELDETKKTAKLQSIQSALVWNVNTCGTILKRLLAKAGPREGALEFLKRWISLSSDWKKFNHAESKLSSESGMLTFAMALVNAALPLVSTQSFSASSIAWEFFVLPDCFLPVYGKDVERMKAFDAESPLPQIDPTTGATSIKDETRIILYALRALGLSTVPLLENLSYLRRAEHHHRRDPPQLTFVRARKQWIKALVGHIELATMTVRFVNGIARWLLQVMGAAADGSLGAQPPIQWLVIPQEIVNDVIACTMLVTAVGIPVPPEDFYYIISLMLVLMGNTTYFPKAHTHALFPPFIMAMLQIPPFKDALYRHPWFQLNIVRGSVNCYCVMEQCFAEKLETRYQLSHCLLECLPLDSLCTPVREEFERGQILERFSNFVTSEVNAAVDNCIECLTKMHEMAEAGKTQERENNDLPEGEEPAPTYDQRGQTLRSNILLFDTTVRLFLQLARRFPQGVAKNMVAQQLAQVLTRSLIKFSGRNSKELKIVDGEKYEFRPKELLLRIVECLTHFKKDGGFLQAVVTCGCNLDELFFAMDNIVTRGLVPGMLCADVSDMKSNIIKRKEQAAADDKVWDDAPDWAVCPLTGDPLLEPVALPPRIADLDDLVIVNWRSIHHVLLTEEINPYTKEKMTEETLKTFNSEPDIKAAVGRRSQRIQAWLSEAQADAS